MDEYQQDLPDQSLRQKLNKMFSRYDYVGVKNPLKVPFTWRVALEQNEILGMSPADPMNEERMAQTSGGTFLPGDSVTKAQQKITQITLEPGEKKMIIGEAAYVVAPRLFNALCREKFGTSKSGLSRLRNPTTQNELIPFIIEGPIINNVGQAMQTFVNNKMTEIEGFTDVQTNPPAGKGANYTPKANSGAKS